MIVWGGTDSSVWFNNGGVYDPATDTWTPTSTTNAFSPRLGHSAVWTASKMVVWGGAGWDGRVVYLNSGGIYDPAIDMWTATSTTNAPAGRSGHTAVWTGSTMIVWDGSDDGIPVDTGGVSSDPGVLPLPTPSANFYTVTPCRLVDTRNAASPTGGPALVAGAVRSFPVTGACGIPSTAVAVSMNLTAVQPAAQGHLILYPGDAAGPPVVSNINFMLGVTRAGDAVARLATYGGTINVKNASAGSVHFVLDVNGCFQ
jgi:hypothetical protein